jgi:L-lactate dehydrogenase complex protein LldE
MLRELRLAEQPRTLLRAVADLRELPRGDRCCGFGGTFSVRYPDVATAMADDKLASAAAAGAETLVSADPGCIMHVEGRAARTGADVRVVHLATILAEAL